MDEVNQTLKKQIAALLRVISAANYYKQDNVPCQIEEGLFLGSVGAAANKDALKNFNVTHVLTVANTLTPAHPDDFVYKTINVVDREDADIKQYFNECFDFIDEGKRVGGTLVHCFAGRSRSVTVVVAYLMKTHRMSLSQALEHVKSRRPTASPNLGFIRQLEDFEKSLQVSN
ncbi:dual specificity protein phosphatase 1-like isoform X1 [Neltuma alba]|uniref:dual specificity protein phosphatase 1 n=1 Tax=Neltuma alba TaxID=207710 RepID=UPI0010A319BB|nr:dual specificity protein phosphatase 1-like [Prosopis alba]XP_028773988.1 dual specificity protein phosphatase 1-like [Prosopis alba]XP_028773989.1 dual specificity protein phosphatase 1-like [Prosopis alba]XP_028773990.1 dual specificity protein phosphatase 1-like [Prosopis alba]XP_028795007.1 dual specificity protein phosphatase 1-like isoform X1 [Prosopis alba]XP_028795008.1 dual specificity protein phosphatase 1-like isoform X1 [Prosopis alba]XP_028795009.1 dual specificity protein pho